MRKSKKNSFNTRETSKKFLNSSAEDSDTKVLKEFIKKKEPSSNEIPTIQKEMSKVGGFYHKVEDKKKLGDQYNFTKSTIKTLNELESIYTHMVNKDISVDNFKENNGVMIIQETLLSTNLLKLR